MDVPDPARKREAHALARENAATVVGNLVLTWGPLSLLGLLSSPVEAARFGVASRCAQIVSFALPALNFVLAPRFAAMRAMKENAKLRRVFIDSLMLSVALSSVMALPIIAFAGPIMGFFGPEYAASVAVLVLLALAQWANGASGAAIQFLAMTGGEKPLRRIFVLTATLAPLAGVVLVWRDGATGAATLMLGSYLMLNVLCTIGAMRQMRRVARETSQVGVLRAVAGGAPAP
jgi:O-antigen/teichoic acid export membrane protein